MRYLHKYIDDQEMWGCNEEIINCLSAIQLAMTFVIKHLKRMAIKPNQNSLQTEREIERGGEKGKERGAEREG